MAVEQKVVKLEELLKGHINGEVVDYKLTRLTKPGENFLSLILKLDITVKNGEKKEELATVVKLVPPAQLTSGDENFKELGNITFNNEIVWYDHILPLFEKFEKDHAVEDFANIYPKFYGGRLNLLSDSKKVDENAAILLENLQDYANADRLIGFDLETSKEILKALAIFHGVTIAYRHLKRKEFDEKILPHINIRPSHDHPNEDNFVKNVLENLSEDPECVPLIPRCQEALKTDPMAKQTFEFREPWATTIHDDFWTNNIMLKKTPGTPKVKIVDFQMVLFKSFAVDLLFFLLTSLENSVLNNNLDELVRFYYDQLIDILKQFKLDTEQFTFESFSKELEIESKAGQFTHSLKFVNIIFADRGAVPDVIMEKDEDFFKTIMEGKNPRQKEKMKALTKACARKNWI